MDVPPLGHAAVPRRKLETRIRKYRGRLYVASADQAFELDHVAEYIFWEIDGKRTVREIGERVAATYGLPLEQALADTAAMLAHLAANEVLTAQTVGGHEPERVSADG
ncbi:PqqD family protein [Streptosporangium sp. NPDC049376]|uniref:PqqD family protein n=1 Tax=Streptosporangium sp. NPDC049376 TaxID=3366192 RepID=UPI003790EBE6